MVSVKERSLLKNSASFSGLTSQPP